MSPYHLIMIVTICVVMFFILKKFVSDDMIVYHQTYTTNVKADDLFIRQFHEKVFINDPTVMRNIHYMVAYHYVTEDQYRPDRFNILIDFEPKDVTDFRCDMAITSKFTKSPRSTPNIVYCPYFAWLFNQIAYIEPEQLLVPPKDLYKKTKCCCFAYSNCDTKRFEGVRQRHAFFEKMRSRMGKDYVDNLGRCLNPHYKTSEWVDNSKLFQEYKFVIAFENDRLDGYITEKLVMPILAGAIPIYLGAPDVIKYFNPKRIINVADYSCYDDCIDFVSQVQRNDKLFTEIVSQPVFQKNMDFQELFSIYYGGDVFRTFRSYLPDNISQYFSHAWTIPNKVNFITTSGHINTSHLIKEAIRSRFFKSCETISGGDNNIIPINTILKYLIEDVNDNDIIIYADPATSSINCSSVSNEMFRNWIEILSSRPSTKLAYLIQHSSLSYPTVLIMKNCNVVRNYLLNFMRGDKLPDFITLNIVHDEIEMVYYPIAITP